jgi:hypothetical protein
VSPGDAVALWATGTLDGRPYRKSLKTRSFERAQQIDRDTENGKREDHAKTVTLKAALDAFVKDCESRALNESTLRKYRALRDNLAAFFGPSSLRLSECTCDRLHEFRQGRDLGPRTAGNELERIRAFFRFCVENDWVAKGPWGCSDFRPLLLGSVEGYQERDSVSCRRSGRAARTKARAGSDHAYADLARSAG